LIVLIASAAFLAPRGVDAAPKTDTVDLVNGDHLTGEIKGVLHNRLELSTEHMGTVYIEWDKVVALETQQFLRIETQSGALYSGQVPSSGAQSQLVVADGTTTQTLPMRDVVRVDPVVRGSFIDRLDGYVSAGFDVAKAHARKSLTFSGGLSSRTRQREWTLDGSGTRASDDTSSDEQYGVQYNYRRLLPSRNFYAGLGSLAHNSELDLDVRTLVGGGLGRYFVRTNRAEWQGTTGLAYSYEDYGSGSLKSLEAVLSTGFSIFRYDYPETDVAGAVAVLPSLTRAGRVRVETNLSASYEIINDLFIALTFYSHYDSESPTGVGENSDYGMTTSLGYSF
jgi:hypothetical protein